MPVAFLAIWFSYHQAFPRLDPASSYLELLVEIKHTFKTSGAMSALSQTYHHRTFKPTLQPLYALPIYAFHQNIFIVVSFVCCSLLTLFCSYLYKIGLIFLTPFRSLIFSLFISSIPFIHLQAHGYSSEIFFIAFATVTLYYLIQSHFLESPKNTILLAVGLTACLSIRPVLTVTTFAIPILYLWMQSYKRRIISWSVFFTFPVIASLTLLWMLLPPYLDQYGIKTHDNPYFFQDNFQWINLIPLLFLALPLCFRKKMGIQNSILVLLVLPLGFFILWYGPFFLRLFAWSAYGAFESGQRDALPIFLQSLINAFGGTYLIGILLTSIVFFLFLARRISQFQYSFFLFITLAIIPNLLITSVVNTNAELYYVFNFILCYLFAAAALLKYSKIFLIPFIAFIGLHVFTLVDMTFNPHMVKHDSFVSKFYFHPTPMITALKPYRKEDPSQVFLKNLDLKTHGKNPIIIGLVFLVKPALYNNENVFHYELFDGLELIKDHLHLTEKLRFEQGALLEKDFNEITPLMKNYNYILVGPTEFDQWPNTNKDAQYILVSKLLNTQLTETHLPLKYQESIEIPDFYTDTHLKYLLYQVVRVSGSTKNEKHSN